MGTVTQFPLTTERVSERNAASPLDGTETVPVTQGGVSKRTTASAIGAAGHPNLAAHNTLGLATQAELDAHAATAHAGPQTTQAALQAALDDGYGVGHHGTIPLTSTLVVGTDTEFPVLNCQGTDFVWNGPAGGTAIEVRRPYARLSNFQVRPGTTDPGVCIDMINGVSPTHSAVSLIENVQLGKYPANPLAVPVERRIDVGIRLSGQVNGDSTMFKNVWIVGAKVACVDYLNPQAINCGWDGLWMAYSERGMWIRGQETTGGVTTYYGPTKTLVRRCNSHYMTTADFVMGAFAGLQVEGFNGEHSARLFHMTTANSEATFRHGYWQRGTQAVAVADGVILGPGGSAASYVALNDFRFTVHPDLAAIAGERCVGIRQMPWDRGPGNENLVYGYDMGLPRPGPYTVADNHKWWDSATRQYIWLEQAQERWLNAVGTVVP